MFICLQYEIGFLSLTQSAPMEYRGAGFARKCSSELSWPLPSCAYCTQALAGPQVCGGGAAKRRLTTRMAEAATAA